MKLTINKSLELWERAKKCVPLGVHTLSKSPLLATLGAYPIFFDSAKGCRVWDVDGNEYIDYTQCLGPIILGYGDERVAEVVDKQMREGSLFPGIHPKELELSELLIDIIPCAEMVRFMKSGAEATSTAIRIARAYTGKEKIAVCGFHGWHDWYAINMEQNAGIPESNKELVHTFTYNNIQSLKKIFDENKGEIAAVIMEPLALDEPIEGFLEEVQALVRKECSILIFDELVTGFRIALGGAQEKYGVVPDLATFNKAIANGMPLSVIAGKKEIMEKAEELFISSTFAAETVSIVAALTTLTVLREEKVIDELWKKGKRLQGAFNEAARSSRVPIKLYGPAVRAHVLTEALGEVTGAEIKAFFLQEMAKQGILMTFAALIMDAHTDEDIEKTITVVTEIFKKMRASLDRGDLLEKLEGEPPRAVFRKHENNSS